MVEKMPNEMWRDRSKPLRPNTTVTTSPLMPAPTAVKRACATDSQYG